MASSKSPSLRSVLEKDNGANFIDLSRNLRNVLKRERRLEVPNQSLPNELEMFQEQARHEKFMTTKAQLVRKGKDKGEEGKGKPKPKPKDKVGPWSKGKGPKPPRPNPQREGMCIHCNNEGHCKGSCPLYLEELNGGRASTSSIFVIEVNLSISTSWVLDTGCGSTFVQMYKD